MQNRPAVQHGSVFNCQPSAGAPQICSGVCLRNSTSCTTIAPCFGSMLAVLSSLSMFFVCYYLPDSTRAGFEMLEAHLIPLVPIYGPVMEFFGASVAYLLFRTSYLGLCEPLLCCCPLERVSRSLPSWPRGHVQLCKSMQKH